MKLAIVAPCRDFAPHLIKVDEQSIVEKLITHAVVEIFDDPVLHRLAGGDDVPVDLVGLAPGGDGARYA